MYICENCKAKKNDGDDVYFIESAFCNFIPTCSKECAEIIKEREIKTLQEKIDRIINTEIKKEVW